MKRTNGGSSPRTGKTPEDVRFDAAVHENGNAASAPASVPHGEATAQPLGGCWGTDLDPLAVRGSARHCCSGLCRVEVGVGGG